MTGMPEPTEAGDRPPQNSPAYPFAGRPFALQWLFHALAMACLGGLIFYQLSVSYDRTGATERERLLNQARIIGRNLSRDLRATHQALLGIRSDPTLWTHAAGPEAGSRRLKTLADAMPGVRTITVLNAEGVVMTSNRADLIGENFSTRAYFETARRLANPAILVVSPPFRTSLGVFAMNLVMMIAGPNGEFSGIVSTTLDPEYFTTLLDSVLYTPDMWSGLTHGNGLLFMRMPEHSGQEGKTLTQPGSFFSRHRDSGQTETVLVGTAFTNGEERMMAQITIKPADVPMDVPLVASISRNLSAIHAKWREDALTQGALYFLLLFVSSAGLFYLHRRQRAFDLKVAQTNRAIEEARHQAEMASRAKSAFLATMSHEIRTPITSVLGMVELLNDTALTTEQAGYVGILSGSTRTLLTILSDILDISKIESGKFTLEAVEFPLPAAVREVLSLNQGVALAKGLVLGLDIAADVPGTVIGDPTRLKQILFNLLSNAIKFTETGSVRLDLSVKARDGAAVNILCKVADTGIGIAEDEFHRLFQAFSQVDPSTTRRFGGTGLGLAIASRLVTLMGGEIGVDSAPGQGSTFWFTLPLIVSDQPATAQPGAGHTAAAGTHNRTLRILVAEDNRINQMLIRSMLEKSGHRVRVVDNGRQAITAVMTEDFDAVLMDMQMPEMDGEEATRVIRALAPPRNSLPVLALTADIMIEHRERYRQAGVNALIAKPIDWQLLFATLETHTAPPA